MRHYGVAMGSDCHRVNLIILSTACFPSFIYRPYTIDFRILFKMLASQEYTRNDSLAIYNTIHLDEYNILMFDGLSMYLLIQIQNT